MMKKYKVIFQPSGSRGEVEEGKTILEAAQALGVDIEGLCGNKKVCGKCKVRIEEGYFEKDNIESGMAHLSPLTEAEKKHIKPEDGPGIRLSCTAESPRRHQGLRSRTVARRQTGRAQGGQGAHDRARPGGQEVQRRTRQTHAA